MEEAKINISELKNEGSDVIKELSTYLKDKTGAKVETGSEEIVVKTEGTNLSRTYIRLLLRKFLHKKELKEYFRVISGKDNALLIKGKEVPEEEE
jgi:hypothetical protein